MTSTTGLEYIRCNLCGADDAEFLFKHSVKEHQFGQYAQDQWDIVRCRRCGLIYENPRPDQEALASFYSFRDVDDYKFVQQWFIDNADLQRRTWNRLINVLKLYKPEGRLIDIGSGTGSFLVEARKANFKVVGQDVSPFFVTYSRTEQSLEIYEGELHDLALPPDYFDCVTAFDVIEHHPYPKQMVTEIQRILKPGGVFMLTTHDVGSLFARLYGPRWRYMYSIGHLTFFNRETITKLLSDCDLQVVRFGGIHTMETSWSREMLNWLVQIVRLLFIRALIIGIYRPLSSRFGFLQKWQLKIGDGIINHEKLLTRAGRQITMNDDFVCVAVKVGKLEGA